MSGSPAFVRQILDDLPALLARLRGESAPTPSSIRMPAPPRAADPEAAPAAGADLPAAAVPDPAPSAPRGVVSGRSLDERVFDLLGGAGRPLAISAIRARLDEPATGQQVRRILERAGNRVVASGDRPMRYRLRS